MGCHACLRYEFLGVGIHPADGLGWSCIKFRAASGAQHWTCKQGLPAWKGLPSKHLWPLILTPAGKRELIRLFGHRSLDCAIATVTAQFPRVKNSQDPTPKAIRASEATHAALRPAELLLLLLGPHLQEGLTLLYVESHDCAGIFELRKLKRNYSASSGQLIFRNGTAGLINLEALNIVVDRCLK